MLLYKSSTAAHIVSTLHRTLMKGWKRPQTLRLLHLLHHWLPLMLALLL